MQDEKSIIDYQGPHVIVPLLIAPHIFALRSRCYTYRSPGKDPGRATLGRFHVLSEWSSFQELKTPDSEDMVPKIGAVNASTSRTVNETEVRAQRTFKDQHSKRERPILHSEHRRLIQWHLPSPICTSSYCSSFCLVILENAICVCIAISKIQTF